MKKPYCTTEANDRVSISKIDGHHNHSFRCATRICAVCLLSLPLFSWYSSSFHVQAFSVSTKASIAPKNIATTVSYPSSYHSYARNRVLSESTASRVSDTVTTLDVDVEDRKSLFSEPMHDQNDADPSSSIKIVLVAGFESFNRELYQNAISQSNIGSNIELTVFSDSELRIMKSSSHSDSGAVNDNSNNPWIVNPKFESAMKHANVFIGSLIFDYDDVMAVQQVLQQMPKKYPKFIFESATELMSYNQVGSFTMMSTNVDGSVKPAGPPPIIKTILSKFSSGKEEDKLSGYLQLLKIGPDILKFIPGETAQDVRTWMSVYRYWNQGGLQNIQSMFQLIAQHCTRDRNVEKAVSPQISAPLPELVVTPDIGLVHPLVWKYHIPNAVPQTYFESSPAAYMQWRLSDSTKEFAEQHQFALAPDSAPRVAVLLFRKHVITQQKYIPDLLTIMEKQGIIPIPIFINGVEAHTIVRDLLTSSEEIEQARSGIYRRDATYQADKAVSVDAIVNTIGFPLVGGPAGSMEAGRNVVVASQLLSAMNVPYIVASPLLLQTIPQWKENGVLGLQSVVLYSLPELDGAVDTVVLGGLVGDKIALIPERVRKLASRIQGWVRLRRTPRHERNIAICLYGFPPNVGAVGTAALLNVPKSLDHLLLKLHEEGYDTGSWTTDPDAAGESLVAALSILCENPVVTAGADRMEAAVQSRISRAMNGDDTVASTLARPGGGLGGAKVRAKNVTPDELEKFVGKYMMKRIRRFWPEKGTRGGQPGVSAKGEYVVAGLQVGNVWIFVQPSLGVEGDPMRLLFERNLTPHPQYVATYSLLRQPASLGGVGAQAIVHMGMHGTVEWLPGQPLGNDRQSWSDELLGDLPNIYVYAANNPSESILAKRRGYGTLVSYNVPPYGRAGLYLELANLKELVDEYRTNQGKEKTDNVLCQTIYDSAQRSGMVNDVPLFQIPTDVTSIFSGTDLPIDICSGVAFADWIQRLSDYLNILQDRLFSSGLRVLGAEPTDHELNSYLEAYFGDRLSSVHRERVIANLRQVRNKESDVPWFDSFFSFLKGFFDTNETRITDHSDEKELLDEARSIAASLSQSTEELTSVLEGLNGGYIKPIPGGDLLRDGPSVLPTGRNIHALDPYRMPSAGAWARGQRAAAEIIRQHQACNDGKFPETVAVTLWGLDAIKTRGESVAIVLALVGAKPVKEGTGRIVRYDLIPLEELGRPRIDVLASLSGIFRDSFANIVDLLDDMFERCANADEPSNLNFVKKHAAELLSSGVQERTAARLFSNPPGDYGSMVNEVVGTGEWEDGSSLGETWRGRNVFSYGRNEGGTVSSGTARPEVLDKLLETTERVVQEIDSVEYGLTDIQEYYANTGALKKAAENRKSVDTKTGQKKKVAVSIIEAFGSGSNAANNEAPTVPVRDLEDVLRLEYRSKLLNPKWRDTMLKQGSGGAYEISQRMTAMIGWSATSDVVDNFVFDQASERYTNDPGIAEQLQKSNPEAFKNVIRRLLEAAGRGIWTTDEANLTRLRNLYSDADDRIEGVI